jgi:hypothetical protein
MKPSVMTTPDVGGGNPFLGGGGPRGAQIAARLRFQRRRSARI